jgi:hypothetical protein
MSSLGCDRNRELRPVFLVEKKIFPNLSAMHGYFASAMSPPTMCHILPCSNSQTKQRREERAHCSFVRREIFDKNG